MNMTRYFELKDNAFKLESQLIKANKELDKAKKEIETLKARLKAYNKIKAIIRLTKEVEDAK